MNMWNKNLVLKTMPREKKAKHFLSNSFSIQDERLSKEIRHIIAMDDANEPHFNAIRESKIEDME